MSDLTDNIITLPSKGALYGDLLPGGKLTIKRLSAYDQSLLFSQGSLENRLTKLIHHATVLPEKLKPDQLLTVDRMAILLAIRTYSFGGQYEFSYKCPECGSKQEHTCNITQDLNQHDRGEMSEPFEVELPDSKKTVALRFLRGKDEEEVSKHSKRMAMQSVDSVDTSNLVRLARLITSVDGVEVDFVVREKFVKEMSARDANLIEDTVSAREPGIDLRVHPECQSCGAVNTMVMPFDREFFRPTAVRP